jgi:hypothetical protein
LAAAIFHLIQTPSEIAHLRTQSRALAASTAWPHIAAAHVAIYEQQLLPLPLGEGRG